MKTFTETRQSRRLFTYPLLWLLVGVLGLANLGIQMVRAEDGLIELWTQSVWRWPELSLGAVTLVLLVALIASYVRYLRSVLLAAGLSRRSEHDGAGGGSQETNRRPDRLSEADSTGQQSAE